MTWDDAIILHIAIGHDEFYKLAKEHGKSDMFIRNVCNNQSCKE